MRRMRIAIPLALLLAGCAGGPKEQPETVLSPQAAEAAAELGTGRVDPVRLRSHLLIFADRFNAELSGTGTTIAERTDDPVVREQTIRWRIRFIPLIYIAVRDPDPRAAYLEALTLCVRMRQGLEVGDGKAWFGDEQQLAVECARRLVADLVAVGEEFFPKETIEKATRDVESFAIRLPEVQIAGASIARSAEAGKSGSGLDAVLSVPMAPVSGLAGVGDTPSSIVYAAQSATQLGQVVEGLPEQTRWQMELLFLELGSLQGVTDVRRDLTRVSESIASIAATAETLPQDVQKQVAKTLDEARTTIREVDTSLATADKVVASIDETSKTLRETAVALQATAETVEAIVKSAAPENPSSQDASPNDDTITELLKTSEHLHATATELRSLIGDLESGKLAGALDQVSRASESTVDYTLKRVTLAGLLLIAALAVALILYRLVAAKLIRPAPR